MDATATRTRRTSHFDPAKNDQKPWFEHFLEKDAVVWELRVLLFITESLFIIVRLLDMCMPIPFRNAFEAFPEN
jgi:hypothetical protein